VTFALVLVTALASFESTVVSTAMPTIIGELRGLALYSWVFSVYLLTSTVTMPVYGRLADLYGRRRILLVAIALFLAGAGACAASRTMTQLIAARGLQGLGAGGLLPIALTVSGDLFSLKERARIQGVFSAVWGIASLAGPLLGAWLTLGFGWRSIFSINVPLGLLAFLLVATQMRETRAAVADPVDVPGAALLCVGVTALLLTVLQRAGGEALPWAARVALLLTGVVALFAFVRLQARREHPLVPPSLFARAHTLAPYAGGVLLGTTIYGVDTFVPLFVQGARGHTAVAAGAVVTPVVLFWALSAAAAARGVVRFGFKRTALVGASLIVAGFTGLIVAALSEASVTAISVACAFVGAGLGPCSIAQVLAIQHEAAERVRGVATSLVPFFRTIGGALGVGALGGILAAGLTAQLGRSASLGEIADPQVRAAIAHALLPVFFVLLALAIGNVWIASRFPGVVSPRTP
jgi:MFS family permease